MTENTPTHEATGTKPLNEPKLIRFLLHRTEDETGVSGTGIVAEGVQFSCGWCALSWLTTYKSCGIYPSVEELERIHGHDGRTKVIWCVDVDAIEMAPALHSDDEAFDDARPLPEA